MSHHPQHPLGLFVAATLVFVIYTGFFTTLAFYYIRDRRERRWKR